MSSEDGEEATEVAEAQTPVPPELESTHKMSTAEEDQAGKESLVGEEDMTSDKQNQMADHEKAATNEPEPMEQDGSDDEPLRKSEPDLKETTKRRRTAPNDFPEYTTYYPTMEELRDWTGLIRKLEDMGAHKAGIVKLIPPKEWTPRKKGYKPEDFDGEIEIETPIQQNFTQVKINRDDVVQVNGSRGAYQARSMVQPKMTVKQYHDLAHSRMYRTPPHEDYDDLERKYWKTLHFVPPIYGADNSQTITDPEVKECNIAKLDTILKHVEEDQGLIIQGVNCPYIYFGMWKATFVWHVEDLDLYAINCVHHGAPKTWYCVPPKYGHLLEKLAKKLFPNIADWCSNFMRHKTCLISPALMEENGVPYQKVVQEERNIIVVFPYAYHSGFNHGWNIAESTNFAMERWIEYGKRYRPCDCSRDKVKVDMTTFVRRYQPEKLDDWLNNRDIAPHPEDPPEVAQEILERARDPEGYARRMEQKLKHEKSAEGTEQIFRTEDGQFLRFNLQLGRFVGVKDQPTLSPSDQALLIKWRKKFEEDAEVDEEMEDQGGNFSKKADFVILDVYQHLDFKHIKVCVFKDTFKVCGKKALENFRHDINNQQITNIKDFVERGVLIKVGRKTKFKKNRKKPEAEAVPDQVHIFQSAQNAETLVMVKPNTFEFVSEPPPEVKKLMEEENMTNFKELVDRGLFTHCSMIANPPKDKRCTTPEAEEILVKHCRHKPSGLTFTINASTNSLLGKRSKAVEDLMNQSPSQIDDMFANGEIVVLGESSYLPSAQTQSKPEKIVYRSYSTPEGLSVNVAFLGRKIVFRWKSEKSDDNTIKNSEFKVVALSDTLRNLTDEKKLVPNDNNNVEDKNTLEKLLRFGVETDKMMLCRAQAPAGRDVKFWVNESDGVIRPEVLRKYEEIFKGRTFQELLKEEVLRVLQVTTKVRPPANENDRAFSENESIVAEKYQDAVILLNKDTSHMYICRYEEEYPESEEVEDLKLETEDQEVVEPPLKRIKLMNVTQKTDVVKDDPTADTKPREEDRSESEFSDSDAYSDAFEEVDNDLDSDEFDKDISGGSDMEDYSDDDFQLGKYFDPNARRTMSGARKRRLIKERKRKAKLQEERRRLREERRLLREQGRDGKSVAEQIRNLVSIMRKTAEQNLENGVQDTELDLEKIVAEKTVQKETLDFALCIFSGFKMVKSQGSKHSWLGLTAENTRDVLLDIISSDMDEAKDDMWSLCKRVLRLLIKTKVQNRSYHIRNLGAIVYGPDHPDHLECIMRRERVRSIVNVLRGIRVMERVSGTNNLIYSGPKDIYQEYLNVQWDKYAKAFGLKECLLQIKPDKSITNNMKKELTNLLYGGSSSRNNSHFTKLEAIKQMALKQIEEGLEIDDQQKRSLNNMDRICNCGTFIYIDGKPVKKGHKKRSKCMKCTGCLAKKCNECKNCLTPSNKQACVKRRCLFPVTPKCPCFD